MAHQLTYFSTLVGPRWGHSWHRWGETGNEPPVLLRLLVTACLHTSLHLYSLVIGQFPLISDPTLSYMSPKCQQPGNKKHGLQSESRQQYLSNLCSCRGSLPLLSYTNLSGFQWGLNIVAYGKGPQTVPEMWQMLSDTSVSNKSGQEVLFCIVRWKKKNLRNPTKQTLMNTEKPVERKGLREHSQLQISGFHLALYEQVV